MCIYPGTTAAVAHSCRMSAMMHPVKDTPTEQCSQHTALFLDMRLEKNDLAFCKVLSQKKMRENVLAASCHLCNRATLFFSSWRLFALRKYYLELTKCFT